LFRGGKGVAADVVYAVAKWRDSIGRQNYRRLGRAWMEPEGAGGWRRRRGRTPEGYLPREAFVVLDELSRRDWFTSPEDFVF
jgi:hypothetical protein